MGFRVIHFSIYVLLLLLAKNSFVRCASGSYQYRLYLGKITYSEYEQLSWNQKINYLDKLEKWTRNEEHVKIIRSALNEKYDSVTLAALQYASRIKLDEYRKDYLKIASNHYNSSVRVQAMEVFQNLPVNEKEVDSFIKISESRDWIVREMAYQTLRLFSQERKEKKYYDILKSRLNEKNPHVLRELFKTLIWYDRKKSFIHLYNRSLHYDHTLEFIFMLRELSIYSNRRILARFKKISRKHPDFIVREEAKKILREVYNR